MGALGRQRPEVPLHVVGAQAGVGQALLGVDEVLELRRVADEEDRRVVADHVAVALLGVELQREAARVADGVREALLAGDGREAREHRRCACRPAERNVGLRELRDVVGHLEEAVRAAALGVDDALGHALAVEVLHLLHDVVVVQRDRARGPTVSECSSLAAGMPESVVVRGRSGVLMGGSLGRGALLPGPYPIAAIHRVRVMRRAHVVALAAAITLVPAASAEAAFNARGSVEQVQVTGAERVGAEPDSQRPSRRREHARVSSAGLCSEISSPARATQQPLEAVDRVVETLQPPSTKHLQPEDPRGRLRLPDAPATGPSSRSTSSFPGPADAGPYPTLIEYSGYGYANPAGPRELDPADRHAPRLRGGRREHARHRLLGRRVRLLRAAPGARRLRRRSRPSPASPGCSTTRSG